MFDNIDNIALANVSKQRTLTNAQIDVLLDKAIAAKSTWVSVHHSPARPLRVPYAVNFIQRAKAKGLKVHARCHHVPYMSFVSDSLTDGTGDLYNFAISSNSLIDSSATSGTTTTLTDTSKNWTTNQWAGFQCYTRSGAGSGQSLYIASNTANTLTFVATNTFAASSVAFDNTTKYRINYERYNDRSFDNPNFGYRKFCLDFAIAAQQAGADSYSVANELSNTVAYGSNISSSSLSNDIGHVQAQKDLVQYIKSNCPAFPIGVSVSDGFWKNDAWINSGSLGPLDWYGYTAYEEESRFFETARKAIAAFGLNNVQADEMSTSTVYQSSLNSGVVTSETDWATQLSRRVKWLKKLGFRNIFRFEMQDDGINNGLETGFGYIRMQNYNPANTVEVTPVLNSYGLIHDTIITNHSLSFQGGKRSVEITDNANLNITGDKLTIQFWTNIGVNDNNSNPTFVRKDLSYLLRLENKKLVPHIWTANNNNAQIIDPDDFPTDRWVHVAYVYNGSTQKIFINGIQKASGPVTGNVTNVANILAIGGKENNNSENIDGRMQELEITNTAVYTSNFTPPTAPPNNTGAILRLVMNDGAGNTVSDTSGNNQIATLTGSASSEKAQWFIGMKDVLQVISTTPPTTTPKSRNIKLATNKYKLKLGTGRFSIKL